MGKKSKRKKSVKKYGSVIQEGVTAPADQRVDKVDGEPAPENVAGIDIKPVAESVGNTTSE